MKLQNLKDIVDKFIDFVKGAELVIHNAEFDIGYYNELKKVIIKFLILEIFAQFLIL